MATKPNQGFLKSLNLIETPTDTIAINNLAGAGIAEDLKIIQNNLRNISTISVTSSNIPVSGGFFTYPNNNFVFTDDDVVQVSVNVNVGSTTLSVGTNYFVCNSDGETQFKLSFTPSTSGINTITVGTNPNYNFILNRKDAVTEQNLINYIQPDIQDTENFSYLGGGASINSTMTATASNNESSAFFITKKYRVDKDTTTQKDLKFEGTVIIKDPVALNVNTAGLANEKSPGVFIGTTRAFSSDNNPWSEVGSALQTSSTEVSVGELNFADNIIIEGLTATSAESTLATTFTHKLPVVINGETYFLLLST